MYTKSMNSIIEEKYPDLSGVTAAFSDFFNHIAFGSIDIASLINNEIHIDDNMISKLYLFREEESSLINLTYIIICKDEERCIKRCIESINVNCDENDEIIVIDTGSNDATKSIISRYDQIKLYDFPWENDFAKIRNIGLDLALNNWVFFIDADEILNHGSNKILKSYLNIIDWYQIKNLAICPNIINHNNYVSQGVTRIINKKSKLKYYGKIHEELRESPVQYGCNSSYIAFNNIVLYHDGYDDAVSKSKNKDERNCNLLKEQIETEPDYPRWLYFYCRDGINILPPEKYEKMLNKVVDLCQEDPNLLQYKVCALSDLISYYLCNNCNSEKAHKHLVRLKKIDPMFSDVFYFETLMKFNNIKHQCKNLLDEVIDYKKILQV